MNSFKAINTVINNDHFNRTFIGHHISLPYLR